MKTIIDSEQTERLKEVCDKYGVKLPKYTEQYWEFGNECDTWKENDYNDISLAELLEWLYSIDNIYFGIGFWGGNDGFCDGSIMHLSDEEKNMSLDPFGVKKSYTEPIDILFELFIWTIENGYYRGDK